MIKSLIIISLMLTSGWQTRVSPHFILHYQSPDRPVVMEILDLLEDQHDRLTQAFDTELIQPVDVYLHPDRKSLTVSVGMENASEWLVGVAINDTDIHLISPLNPPGRHTKESVLSGLIHELVHICVASAKGTTRLPLWLNEGLAVYYANQRQFAREVPGILRARQTYPNLSEFEDLDFFEKNRGYAISYTLVEFMVNHYGQQALKSFVKNYPNYNYLGVSSRMQMQNDWQIYLRDNYLNPPPLQKWQQYQANVFETRFAPNPVQDFAQLEFETGEDSFLSLRVLDPWGETIQVLFQRPLKSGFHEFRIDATYFPSGVYYLEIQQKQKLQLIQFNRD